MKENYTSAEARAALHVDAKTFLRWLEQGNITPHVSKADHRVKIFTHEQIAQLAVEHGRQIDAERDLEAVSDAIIAPTIDEARIAQLEARIDALETRLATIEEKKHQAPAPVRVLTPPRATYATHERAPGDTLPDGWVTVQEMIKQYPQAKRATVFRNLTTIKPGRWIVNGHEVTNALDAEGQAEFLKLFVEKQ